MKRVLVDRFGGPEVITVIEEDDPDRGLARSASGS